MADMAVVIGTKARTVAILEGHFVLIVAMLLFLLLVSLWLLLILLTTITATGGSVDQLEVTVQEGEFN